MATPNTGIQTEVKEQAINLFSKPAILEKFQAILKGGTSAYIQSALICIADNPSLMECTPQSLVKSALRSATLGLSLDPALRQGFLIPRWDKKAKAKLASFQPHYNGLYQLAQRTGKYRAINVSAIHEGEKVYENVQTGLHGYIPEGYGTLALPNNQISGLDNGYRDVTSGKNTNKVIGYLAYFKTMDGLEKSVWMTIKEIHEHAQKWAPDNYNSEYSAWKDPKKIPTMEMKTAFLALTKFMDLSGERNATFRQAIEADARQDEEPEDSAITGEVTEIEPEPQPQVIRTGSDNDPVSPIGAWATKYAAEKWNCDASTASQEIAKKRLPATMKRHEFIAIVTGAA